MALDAKGTTEFRKSGKIKKEKQAIIDFRRGVETEYKASFSQSKVTLAVIHGQFWEKVNDV